MFFVKQMEHRVMLHPSYFGRGMKELVTNKLIADVEGKCFGDFYIILVMNTFEVSGGRCVPGTGLAEFTVDYQAVVYKPFKGEVLDAIVTSTNQQGFFAMAGPLKLFVSSSVSLPGPPGLEGN
jgi:DNA-directed RNA polymerase II subunit RPB7